MTANLNVMFRQLIGRIDTLERVVRRQAVRINNMVREGVVTAADFENGTAEVDAHGVVTKPIPWLEQAGAVNEWTPLSVGQRVLLFSPDGDLGKAVIMRGGFTDQVKPPHNKGAEKRVTIGNCVITQTGEGLTIQAGGATFVFSGEGFSQTGGNQTHDGVDVGKTHVHRDVEPGAALSGPPNG